MTARSERRCRDWSVGGLVGVLVWTAILLAGCGNHPLIPKSALASTSAPASQSPQPKSTINVAALSPPVLGVDVYVKTSYSNAVLRTDGTRVLRYIKNDLNVQSVGIVWNLCSPGFHSDVVRRCAGSLSPHAVFELVRIAKSDGLTVQLRPLIRVGPPAGWNNPKVSWEGRIQPQDQQKWFASLLSAELPYLQIARSVHGEFVVATELQAFGPSPYWSGFLASAHQACQCKVSYAASSGVYLTDAHTLPPTTAYGTDFYPNVNLPARASQHAVTAAWLSALANVPVSRRALTSLDEVSIRGTVGAYRHPAEWNFGGANDQQVQARWFTAACQAVAQYHMRAVYFYMMPISDDPAHSDTFPAFFVNNAGSRAIKACRKILADGS
jgi:hypothetical protein